MASGPMYILLIWECDKVTLPLSSHGEACRKLKLHSGVSS